MIVLQSYIENAKKKKTKTKCNTNPLKKIQMNFCGIFICDYDKRGNHTCVFLLHSSMFKNFSCSQEFINVWLHLHTYIWTDGNTSCMNQDEPTPSEVIYDCFVNLPISRFLDSNFKIFNLC